MNIHLRPNISMQRTARIAAADAGRSAVEEEPMGAEPYWYLVKYRPEVDAALDDLREREFRAGRYNPVMPFIDFPLTRTSPAPGPAHRTIADAVAASAADGTRSILDITGIADEPDFGVACPLPAEVLQALYGTTGPALAAVEGNMDFLEDVERGHAVYVVCYSGGTPSELLFAGYSYD